MKKRILFVDDEPNALDGLRRMLIGEQGWWDMSFVTSADAAISQLLSGEFDAVVVDVQMPGKDGFALLSEMQMDVRIKDVPVIILTGLCDTGLKRKALDLGATDLLTKPIDQQDLIARLRNVLRIKSYQDELKNQNAILDNRVRQRTTELADSRLDIIWRLAKAVEFRDDATGNHVIRVGLYSRVLAETLGMSRDFCERILHASPLHDVGKIGIPDSILLKCGTLTEEEWEIMKRHCAMGADLLSEEARTPMMARIDDATSYEKRSRKSKNPLLATAASIALTHHEKWDGSGYPAGLMGEEIPIESRIVALSDTFDALTMVRSYKQASGPDEVRSLLRSEMGKHFAPDVHAAFERSLEEFRSIMEEFSSEMGVSEYAGGVL